MDYAECLNFNFYNYLFNYSADPRVTNWLFMNTPSSIILTSIIYLFTIYKFLPFFMSSRKPFNLTVIIKIYNIFQIIACSFLVYGMLTAGWLNSYTIFCQPSDFSNDPDSIKMVTLMWWTLIVKYFELFETCFFILRKKYNQVSNLHVYHHVSTLFITWMDTKYGGSGMASFPMIVNSFVHIIMYTYYFLSSMGPQMQMKTQFLKSKITFFQISQFCILIVHSMQALNPRCDINKLVIIIFIADMLVLLSFFVNFYMKSYVKKKKAK